MELTVSFGSALLAGALSFASACLLPVIPAFLAVVFGTTLPGIQPGEPVERIGRVFPSVVAFGIGFGLVFLTFGISTYPVGVTIAQLLRASSRVGGVVFVVLGLDLLWTRRWIVSGVRSVLTASAGVVAASGWTPCIGPTFGSILYFTGRPDTWLAGELRLVAYGIGLAIPFALLASIVTPALIPRRPTEGWYRAARWTIGTLLVVAGIVMVSGHYARWTGRLAALGPWLTLESF